MKIELTLPALREELAARLLELPEERDELRDVVERDPEDDDRRLVDVRPDVEGVDTWVLCFTTRDTPLLRRLDEVYPF